MLDALHRQFAEFADALTDPAADSRPDPHRFRPRVLQLEDRSVPAALIPGAVLNVWFDGSYSNSPYDAQPTSAQMGVSQFDPASGAVQQIHSQPVPLPPV